MLAAFAFGRFTGPEKVRTVTLEVEKKTEQTDTDKNRHKKTISITLILPDGTKKTTTTTTDDTEEKTKERSTDDISKTSEKEVIRGAAKVTVSALAAINLTKGGTPDYGLAVSKPILGPITIGAFGFQSGAAGLSLGLTF